MPPLDTARPAVRSRGILSDAEAASLHARALQPDPPASLGVASRLTRAEFLFHHFDRNVDGVLDQDELEMATETLFPNATDLVAAQEDWAAGAALDGEGAMRFCAFVRTIFGRGEDGWCAGGGERADEL